MDTRESLQNNQLSQAEALKTWGEGCAVKVVQKLPWNAFWTPRDGVDRVQHGPHSARRENFLKR